MKKICPVCGGKEFVTTAHVTQDWKVNGKGEWLETVTDFVQIDHGPDPDNIWTCCRCEAEAVDEKDFPYNQDQFTLFCQIFDKKYYVTATRETGDWINVTLRDIQKQTFKQERLYKESSGMHLIDEIPFILECLFGISGKLMTVNRDENHWYKLTDMYPKNISVPKPADVVPEKERKGNAVSLGTMLELFDDWNGKTRVNDDSLNLIIEDRTVDIYDNRKDLLERTVLAYGMYNGVFTVRLAD